jgi:hypothetical protein
VRSQLPVSERHTCAPASWFSWRWIFFANIPFPLALPQLVAETTDWEGRRLDPVGIALLTASLG